MQTPGYAVPVGCRAEPQNLLDLDVAFLFFILLAVSGAQSSLLNHDFPVTISLQLIM